MKRTEIAWDNVAGIRATSNTEQIGDDSSDASSENRDSDGTLNLRYSYLTSASKTENDSKTDTAHDFLSGAAKTIGVQVDAERTKYKQAQSRRSSAPLNEFTHGDQALLGGWPDVFLLGKSGGSLNKLSDKQVVHLLMQFTTAAASCQLLIFYLFDRKQRHSVLRNMAAKIRCDPKKFDDFAKKDHVTGVSSKIEMCSRKTQFERGKAGPQHAHTCAHKWGQEDHLRSPRATIRCRGNNLNGETRQFRC